MTNVPEFEDLQRVELFYDLTEAQMTVAQRLCQAQELAQGEILVAEDQPGDLIYIILTGSVKIFVAGGAGQEVILAMRGPGEVIGEMSLLDGLGRSASVVTQEPCRLLSLNRLDFWSELWEMPPITYNLARILTRRLRLATAQIQALSALDTQARLARQLLAFAQDYGHAAGDDAVLIPLHMTQAELANMVGSSRVRVNQVMGYWKRRKYISVDRGHRITVLNKAALAQYCA